MRPSPSARLFRGALTAGVALGLSATVLSSPARAESGYARCGLNQICAFSAPLGQGDMLVLRKSAITLGAWDNRIRSLANFSDESVCFHPEPGLAPDRATAFGRGSISFDESPFPELDRTISSVELGPGAGYYCGSENRYAILYGPKPRPAAVPPSGAFGDIDGDLYADLFTRDGFGRLWTSHHDERESTSAALVGGGWGAMTKVTRHGDYDRDGHEDVFARDKDGVLWFYPGNGKGWFKPRLRVGGGWNSVRDLAAAGDLTGDGRGDLLATDGAGVLWTYPGDGQGRFGARKKVGGGWKSVNELVGAGDMNSDGKADLVARDAAGRLWLYPGNGRGWFTPRRLIGAGGWNGLRELVGLGDVTGDGTADLIARLPTDPDGYAPTLRLYPGSGAADGHLQAPKPFGEARGSHVVF
ncbi:FG-GAP-like repeat-containing protein [Streptomyces sp. NPDC057494]|uniref:FG-GAP-like repeat-containing protein n=1 Tax=Streptomyces sp. NPDC057494 TaxID=3346148 RepID=UPI00367EA6B4